MDNCKASLLCTDLKLTIHQGILKIILNIMQIVLGTFSSKLRKAYITNTILFSRLALLPTDLIVCDRRNKLQKCTLTNKSTLPLQS